MATYVLVHGAYQGSWIWKPVVERLRAAGHSVHAPTLDGCAERRHGVRPGITTGTHAREVAGLLFYEDLREVVLVGTSAGGMVICLAAELAADRLARLVFVDALALLPGERVADIVSRPPAQVTELTIGPTPADAEARMFADLDPALRAWALPVGTGVAGVLAAMLLWTGRLRREAASHRATAQTLAESRQALEQESGRRLAVSQVQLALQQAPTREAFAQTLLSGLSRHVGFQQALLCTVDGARLHPVARYAGTGDSPDAELQATPGLGPLLAEDVRQVAPIALRLAKT